MRRLAIQNSLKCMGTLQIFIVPHWYFILNTGLILRSIELFIYIQTYANVNAYMQLRNRLWTTIALFHFCSLIWGLTNYNYSLYFLLFLNDSVNIRLYYIFILNLYIVGPLSKLADRSFFCWRLHKYELLQFVWY